MKKFLALVLALVMTMSLVTIAGAEDYTDADSMNYAEAVEVMSAAGVVGGYADGSFNPQAGLTRGAAAKIICNMILGPTTAEALTANEAPYSDVAVDNVFAGYIAYCANEGIISGYADGTFKPAAPLTGYAFMKMLLGALGYDAAIEGYTGSNWSIQVAKRALAIGLDDGLVGKFNGSKALTREEACLYAFNAMNTKMVKYDTKSTISVGDIVISQNSEAEETNTLFRTKYFEDLTKHTAVVTEAGRPAHTWKWDRDTIGTYADAADYVLVLDKDYSKETDALAVIQDLTENEDLTWDYADGKQITDLYVNGKNCNGEDYAAAAVQGNVVELYVDKYDAIEDVVAFTYQLKKIEKVSTSLTKAQKEDGATCKVTFEGETAVLDTEIAGFDAETYVKGAYVLVCKNADKDKDENVYIDTVLAETVEGKVESKKGATATIDGVAYDLVNVSVSVNDEGTFYLNLAGQIIKASTDAKSDNYAYIYSVVKESGYNADGIKGDTYTAYAVLADGTKASYVIDTDDADTKAALCGEFGGDVVAYDIDSDNLLTVATAKDTIVGPKALVANKDKAAGTLSTTEFIFAYYNDTKTGVKVDTATGYKNVDIDAKYTWTVTNADSEIVYVFVADSNGNVMGDANLAVILDTEAKETKNADGDVIYTYTVAIDGVESALTFEKAQKFTYGQVYAYEIDGDYAVEDKTVTVNNVAKVAAANAGYFMDGEKQINLGDEVSYTITVEYDDEADYKAGIVDSVIVSEDGTVEKDDQIAYVMDGDELAVVFVYEYIY